MGVLRREDLRVKILESVNETRQERTDHYAPVSDADLRSIPGLPEALTACEHCEGNGLHPEPRFDVAGMPDYDPCPACDGSGIDPHERRRLLGRLLPDVDPEEFASAWRYGVHHSDSAIRNAAWQALAEQIDAVLNAMGGSDATP